MALTCEILGGLTPLNEPEFGKLVNRVVRQHQRQQTNLRQRLVGEVVAAWEKDRAVSGGPAIDARPMRNSLDLPGNVHPLAGMDGY